MQIVLTGRHSGQNFVEAAFYDDVFDLEILSATSTQIVLENPGNGAVTTLSGTGFTFSPGGQITGGTLTGWTTRNSSSEVLTTVTGISWNAVTFQTALFVELYENDNPVPFYALMSQQDITLDARLMLDWFPDINPEGITSRITIYGTQFGDVILGGDGNDTIDSGGSAGDIWGDGDTLVSSRGSNTYVFTNHGPDSNYVDLSYAAHETGISAVINGATGTGSVTHGSGTDTLLDVANALNYDGGFTIFGSGFADTFNVTLTGNQWMGVFGGRGVDSYVVNVSNDAQVRVDFSGNWDDWLGATQGLRINLATGVIANDGYGHAETISVTNSGGRLEIGGTAHADSITGSNGDEVFTLRGGNDTVNGGGGWDEVRYDRSDVTSAVNVDLQAGTATGAWRGAAFSHSLSNIEEVSGSAHDDTLRGSSTDNYLDGGDGDDYLVGRAGNDTLRGRDGNDTLDGGAGNDRLDVGRSELGGGDLVIASAGNDTVIYSNVGEGEGWNDLTFSELGAAVTLTINGAANTGTATSSLGTTTLVDVANVLADVNDGFNIFGTTLGDTFNINGGADSWVQVFGGKGADSYIINLTGMVRLNFSGSFEDWDGATHGLAANFTTGVISNDGFGNAETISLTLGANRFEVVGTNNADSIVGSAGGDVFILQAGNDTLNGGNGYDTLRYDRSEMTSGVTVDLAAGTATGSWDGMAFTHILSGIEEVRGTNGFNDVLRGSALAERLDGRDGDDTVEGGGGNDTLVGRGGNDLLRGGAGLDRAVFVDWLLEDATFGFTGDGNLNVILPDGTDTLYGDIELLVFEDDILTYAQAAARVPGVMVVNGSPNGDGMTATPGAAVYMGNDGNDWITPGGGADTVDGGEGTDMVSFNDATKRVVIDLAVNTAVIEGVTTVLQNVENITATSFADLITGDDASNLIRGMGDYDWLVGSGGNDTFDGGNGRDTVAYSAASAGVIASLLTKTGTGGQAAGDSYINVENLTGSSHVDRLTGDNDRNTLRGLAGDDFIFGRNGNDTIDGGSGRDSIDGGNGNDRITGGRGNDTIIGGAGWDTAFYSGNRSAYTITTRPDGSTTVLHNGGGIDGMDIVWTVEVLQFADGKIFL